MRKLRVIDLFAVSEILLLCIANALLANAADRAIALGWLPALIDPLWDLSAWLADGQGAGRLLADFTGYRAVLGEAISDPQTSADVISTLTTTLVFALNRGEPGWTEPASDHLVGCLDELEFIREVES